MSPHALDSATISFGLVAIPIKVYTTNEPSKDVQFHMIHAGCGERLSQRYVCPTHGEVERADIGKGAELAKGTYLELSKDELKALAAVSTDEIQLTEFVPVSAIDPLYIDRSYYLGTDKGGERGYRLLREAMTRSEVVGIASYSVRGKQYVVMLRPFENGMIMHQLRYPDEIKAWDEVPVKSVAKVDATEIDLAIRIVAQITHASFDPGRYRDEVKVRVRAMIKDKAKGKELIATAAPTERKIVDLMEALKASLAAPTAKRARGHAKPKRATRATSTTRRAHTSSRARAA